MSSTANLSKKALLSRIDRVIDRKVDEALVNSPVVKKQSPIVAKEISGNEKLGKLSATYVSQGSCPLDCAFRNSGCYAEYGYAAITTKRVNESGDFTPAELARREAKGIDGLTGKRDMRLHVVGDCSTDYAAKIVSSASRRYQERHGKRVYTYTHAWRKVDRQSWRGVSVLASCEAPSHIADARARGYAAAIVVERFKDTKAYSLDNGEKVIPCPAQTKKGVTCETCKLCMDSERLLKSGLSIAFEAHSQGKRYALEMLSK
jgi:hypothetical protein